MIAPKYLKPSLSLCLYYSELECAGELAMNVAGRLQEMLGGSQDVRVDSLVGQGVHYGFGAISVHDALGQLRGKKGQKGGRSPFACVVGGPSRKVCGMADPKFAVTASDVGDWGGVGEGEMGGARLVVSVGNWCVSKLCQGGACGLSEVLKISAQYGEVCHGVVDYDYYVANRSGEYYSHYSWPCLKERLVAARNWGSIGGSDRVRLCRDPREALVLGSNFCSAIGLGGGGDSAWIRRHKLYDGGLAVVECGYGVAMVCCSRNIYNFEESVRMSPETRRASELLMSAMCSDGHSKCEYKILHSEKIELYSVG